MPDQKPPLGLKPRCVHDGERAMAIMAAMKRYIEKHKPIPKEWADELLAVIETYQ